MASLLPFLNVSPSHRQFQLQARTRQREKESSLAIRPSMCQSQQRCGSHPMLSYPIPSHPVHRGFPPLGRKRARWAIRYRQAIAFSCPLPSVYLSVYPRISPSFPYIHPSVYLKTPYHRHQLTALSLPPPNFCVEHHICRSLTFFGAYGISCLIRPLDQKGRELKKKFIKS